MLRLGQTLGTRVIADGVETAGQVEFLRRRKCDEVQGYLFGKPVALEEFERTWLARATPVTAAIDASARLPDPSS